MKNITSIFVKGFLKSLLTRKLFVFLILIFLILPQYSCNTTEPPSNATLTLNLEDVSCKEAWLTLTTTNLQLPNSITLLINDLPKKTINLVKADTILIVDSLLPNQTYTFITAGNSGLYGISSNKVTATTLDTTSHNYTWQTFEFGDGQYSSSVLFDVTIIDENNIWAVGEIYMNDSLGNPDPTRYNAVIWDGQKWSIQRIPYFYQGQPFYNPIQSIFAYGPNDIWFCGNGVIHWNGNNFVPMPVPTTVWGPYSMNKIWGRNNNDLYVVGDDGLIAHYNTGYWQKMESGTNIRLTDIYSAPDGKSIFVCGWDWNTGNSIILNISNFNNPKVILNNIYNEDDRIFASLWTDGKQIILGGNRVFRRYLINDALNESVVNTELVPTDYGSKWFLPGYFIYSLRGTGLNNLFIAGDGGMIWHFNGISWYQYEGLFATNRRLYGTAVKDNIFAAVGTNSRALIIIGKR